MNDPEASTGTVPQGLVVFVHGYMDSPGVWARTISQLALPGWRTIAATLETPHQQSGAPADLLQLYAGQVVDQVDAATLLAGLPVVIVGHSMGGQIAELVACSLGAQAAGLVLVTPAPLAGYPLPPAVMDRFASRAGITDAASIRDGKRALSVALDDEALEILVQSTAATSRDTALAQLHAWTGGHLAGHSPSFFGGPALTVTTDDKFFTTEMLAQGSRRFRRAVVEHIGGAGHWPQLEQSEGLAQAIRRFVQSQLQLG
ncbi:alpha/beta fold hydrolase [Variovorax ginsengisoli]|uniref:Alpha/beta hydrolase n=1 Tax=Variovorax ginsengisoli TaxID=363844 RepID=A0ABT8SF36_9BURK|nr:alpha/beta hydrolase [Variovorax ginsengisoli]MDN8617432.1 alpha/beta hydrolase [Variovorax ginsengisoli]MDO1536602.1 alpha/beta hydrolase [Variovorax ginsengisoli]